MYGSKIGWIPVTGAGAEAAVQVAADRRQEFVRRAHRRQEFLGRGLPALAQKASVVPTAGVCTGRHKHCLDAEVQLAEDATMTELDSPHLLGDQGPLTSVQGSTTLSAAKREIPIRLFLP